MPVDFELLDAFVSEGKETQIETVENSLTVNLTKVKLIARSVGTVDLSDIKAFTAIDKVTAIAIVPDKAIVAIA